MVGGWLDAEGAEVVLGVLGVRGARGSWGAWRGGRAGARGASEGGRLAVGVELLERELWPVEDLLEVLYATNQS